MQTFKTKEKVLNVPTGTKVTYDKDRDNVGKTGKLLCGIPTGGSLFFSKDQLEEVK